MKKQSIFEYARSAAQAEQKILELLDGALKDDLAEEHSDADIQMSARTRQGQKPSG